MAIADRVKSIQLWDLDKDVTLGPLNNPATAASDTGGHGLLAGRPDLAIGRTDGTIELWDVRGQRLLKSLRGHTDQFTHTMLRFSPDTRTLAVTGYRWKPKSTLTKIMDEIRRILGYRQKVDAEILVLDVATGRRLAGSANSGRPFFSPDGRTLATGEPDGSTKLRDIPRR